MTHSSQENRAMNDKTRFAIAFHFLELGDCYVVITVSLSYACVRS